MNDTDFINLYIEKLNKKITDLTQQETVIQTQLEMSQRVVTELTENLKQRDERISNLEEALQAEKDKTERLKAEMREKKTPSKLKE